ncbi:MAG: AMP-binding protein [Opitutaceae bacterium]
MNPSIRLPAPALPAEASFMSRLAAADPGRIAIIDLARERPVRFTFAELDAWAERTAQGLLDRGVRPGENVAFILPNGWEFVVLSVAIWKIGAVVCPMLPALREREITFIVNRSRSRILIAPEEYHGFRYGPMIEAIRKDMPRLESTVAVAAGGPAAHWTGLGGLASAPADRAALAKVKPAPDAMAQLLFTSGTTGEPKGVLHSMTTLSHGLDSHARVLRLTGSDRIWVPSPMGHQTGFLYGMMIALYLGAPQICQPSWNTELARRAVEREGATFVQAAMPFLADLAALVRPPRGLRKFVATGAAVPRQLAREAGEALGCSVIGGWGSTESCLVTVGHASAQPTADEAHWKSDGRVIPGMEMVVRDAEGRPLPDGQEGHFWVKTPAMFVGYLDHPEWYESALDADGFFDTGDLAALDADGHLHIKGRLKDVINRGGEKIPAAELEDILYQFDAVRQAAIVAMPDARLGERICAYIAPKDPDRAPSKEEIIAFFKGKGVTKIYWPEHIEYLERLPTTASGKVQKYLLRQMIAEKVRQPEFRLGG